MRPVPSASALRLAAFAAFLRPLAPPFALPPLFPTQEKSFSPLYFQAFSNFLDRRSYPGSRRLTALPLGFGLALLARFSLWLVSKSTPFLCIKRLSKIYRFFHFLMKIARKGRKNAQKHRKGRQSSANPPKAVAKTRPTGQPPCRAPPPRLQTPAKQSEKHREAIVFFDFSVFCTHTPFLMLADRKLASTVPFSY